MGECHVEFALFEHQNFPSPSSSFKKDSDFHEIDSFHDWQHVDPFMFECIVYEGIILDYARVEFNALAPPSVTKDEPYVSKDVSMSDYCRFAQVVQSMPPIDDIKCDFD